MTIKAPKTIAIIGSAIAGPTLAAHILTNPLLRSAYRPILLDQAPAPASEQLYKHQDKDSSSRAGATVGLFANGLYPLRQLGLGHAVETRGFECRDLSTWQCDYAGAKERLNTQRNAMYSHDLQAGVFYFERQALQSLLVDHVKSTLGGDVSWDSRAVGYETLQDGRVRIRFANGSDLVADLLVGADGGYSGVRKFILDKRGAADARWLPDFMGLTGFYGISASRKAAGAATHNFEDSHLIFLDEGFLATGPCPDGKTRWDLILPEKQPPEVATTTCATTSLDAAASPDAKIPKHIVANEEPWQSVITPGQYPLSSTIETLQRHRNVFHPYAGRFEALLTSADRIIRTPLRQRVWREDEIQCGNAVVIGDAARLMLPTSGQGTSSAIEDATVLASVLLRYSLPKAGGSGEDAAALRMRKALEEYARLRVARSKKMANMADLAARWSTNQAWYYRLLRYYGSKWLSDGARKPTKDPWPFNGRYDL